MPRPGLPRDPQGCCSHTGSQNTLRAHLPWGPQNALRARLPCLGSQTSPCARLPCLGFQNVLRAHLPCPGSQNALRARLICLSSQNAPPCRFALPGVPERPSVPVCPARGPRTPLCARLPCPGSQNAPLCPFDLPGFPECPSVPICPGWGPRTPLRARLPCLGSQNAPPCPFALPGVPERSSLPICPGCSSRSAKTPHASAGRASWASGGRGRSFRAGHLTGHSLQHRSLFWPRGRALSRVGPGVAGTEQMAAPAGSAPFPALPARPRCAPGPFSPKTGMGIKAPRFAKPFHAARGGVRFTRVSCAPRAPRPPFFLGANLL
ncbi:DBF4-type zinc finger-containing protein 2 homolog [Antechinus flavipes]|uniref:DBF4-type zinc finger-containing protein 2 homolog n=1 Tax=Antechinus flavipes TaxID=38775 RepID=UPI0022354D37|nr:DBF4-type zinc finger-containing protein 2 homolog [Antechinus flavipes]